MKQASKPAASEAPRKARGRKLTAAPEGLGEVLNVNAEAIADAGAAANVIAATDQLIAAEGQLYRLAGRIEAAHFHETVSSKLIIQGYIQARDLLGKLGSVTVLGADGKAKRVSRLEDFCNEVMPLSLRRCQQLAANFETVGSELFDQAERIGFRARDYQALKALPADDQAAVKAALSGGSREEVIDLLTELAARNEALRKRAAEAEKNVKAKQAVLDKKQERLDVLEEQLARRESADPTEQEQAQLDAIRDAGAALDIAIRRMVGEAHVVISQPASESAAVAARNAVDYCAQVFAQLVNEAGLPVDFEERVTPHWLKGVPVADKTSR